MIDAKDASPKRAGQPERQTEQGTVKGEIEFVIQSAAG